MGTDKQLQINTISAEATYAIAEQMGQQCIGGEFFLLVSDVGGGKTTFTKGLAKGLGSSDTVSSPTFTVSQLYDCRDDITIHHFDFYRLHEGGMVALELAEVLEDPKAVVVVEWGDVVSEVLPRRRITIAFGRTKSGEDHRRLTVTYPEALNYIAHGVVV